jgi:hypothetical protein
MNMADKPFTSRFSELEERFLELEHRIPQGPEKEAIALLHAMIQEAPRRPAGPATGGELTLQDVSDLIKSRLGHGRAPRLHLEVQPAGLIWQLAALERTDFN